MLTQSQNINVLREAPGGKDTSTLSGSLKSQSHKKITEQDNSALSMFSFKDLTTRYENILAPSPNGNSIEIICI